MSRRRDGETIQTAASVSRSLFILDPVDFNLVFKATNVTNTTNTPHFARVRCDKQEKIYFVVAERFFTFQITLKRYNTCFFKKYQEI